jgi:hypothetical protein
LRESRAAHKEVMLLNAGFIRNELLHVPRSPQNVVISTK